MGAGRGDRRDLGGGGADQLGQRGAVAGRAAAAGLHRAGLRAGHPAAPRGGDRLLLRRRRLGDADHADPGPHRGARPGPHRRRRGVHDASPSCSSAIGTPRAEEARRALTTALNAAYDRVIRSRSHSAGRIRELSELAGVLNAAAPLVEGAVAAARADDPPDPQDVAADPRPGRRPRRRPGAVGGAAAAAGGRHPRAARRAARRPPGVERRRRSRGAGRRRRHPARGRPPHAAARARRPHAGQHRQPRLRRPAGAVHVDRRDRPPVPADRSALLGAADRRDRAQARLRLGVHPRDPARRRHPARRADRLGTAGRPAAQRVGARRDGRLRGACSPGPGTPTSDCSRCSRRR